MIYDREAAVTYAHAWAYKRNERYYNFDALGGDCTNFVSQCLLAGSDGVMDYTPDIGWYYKNINNRAPAWTGVEFLYRYLVAPDRKGPRGVVLPLKFTQPGDIIQLSFDGEHYAHSLLVVKLTDRDIFVATHSEDADNRKLRTYPYRLCRLLHVTEVNEIK